jgi:hypothetical protein
MMSSKYLVQPGAQDEVHDSGWQEAGGRVRGLSSVSPSVPTARVRAELLCPSLSLQKLVYHNLSPFGYVGSDRPGNQEGAVENLYGRDLRYEKLLPLQGNSTPTSVCL